MDRQGSKRKKPASRQDRTPRVPRYSTLTTKQKDLYDKTTNLITDVRNGKGTYTALRRKYHLPSSTARKYAGRDLVGGTRGKRVRASKSDRRVRNLMFPESFGDVSIRTRSSRDATKLASYYGDREKLLRDRLSPNAFETKWRGVVIAKREVFADADRILHMAEADVFRMESLYAAMGTEK